MWPQIAVSVLRPASVYSRVFTNGTATHHNWSCVSRFSVFWTSSTARNTGLRGSSCRHSLPLKAAAHYALFGSRVGRKREILAAANRLPLVQVIAWEILHINLLQCLQCDRWISGIRPVDERIAMLQLPLLSESVTE